jgi:hypothetical protein
MRWDYWRNAYVEQVIGSIQRCLDYVAEFKERYLRRILLSYVDYNTARGRIFHGGRIVV